MTFLKAAALSLIIAGPAVAEPIVSGTRMPFEEDAILGIAEELDLWLDVHTDLPRAETRIAEIALIPAGTELDYEGTATTLDNSVRGLYDQTVSTIYLVRPWFGDTARDRSVLLHEMIHHRQASAQHWYCPQAMEWDAYLLQEDYLKAHGQTGGFNWAWLALASSCAVRDHHPD